MLIIVDGYNFIFTVPELEKHVEANRIESVRDYVISLFSKYKGEKEYDITVVFDGTHAEVLLPKKQISSGVTVIYSKTGINADTEIKNITTRCQNPQDVCIVTYDNDIKRHVRKCGCRIIAPRELYKKILEVLNKDKESASDETKNKRYGPSENDAKYWKDVFKDVPQEIQKHIAQEKSTPALKKKKKSRHATEVPFLKCPEDAGNERQYWVRVFEETEKNDP